jgi:membrane-bound ClpP family serine protease
MYADAGPPLVVMAIGLVLWLAVTATVAGIAIHTVGLILFVVGAVWLVIEMVQARTVTRADETVVYRDRRL